MKRGQSGLLWSPILRWSHLRLAASRNGIVSGVSPLGTPIPGPACWEVVGHEHKTLNRGVGRLFTGGIRFRVYICFWRLLDMNTLRSRQNWCSVVKGPIYSLGLRPGRCWKTASRSDDGLPKTKRVVFTPLNHENHDVGRKAMV